MRLLHSSELGASLRELLDVPLEAAVDLLGGVALPAKPTEIATARALFAHPSPPIALLDVIFLAAAQKQSAVPRSVADVLQLAALSVGIQRCGVEVQPEQQPVFRKNFEVACGLKWVDEDLLDLLDDGLAAMTPYDTTPIDHSSSAASTTHDAATPAAEPESMTADVAASIATVTIPAPPVAASAPSVAPNSMRGILTEMANVNQVKSAKPRKSNDDENRVRPRSIGMVLLAALVTAAIVAIPIYLIITADDGMDGPKALDGIDTSKMVSSSK